MCSWHTSFSKKKQMFTHILNVTYEYRVLRIICHFIFLILVTFVCCSLFSCVRVFVSRSRHADDDDPVHSEGMRSTGARNFPALPREPWLRSQGLSVTHRHTHTSTHTRWMTIELTSEPSLPCEFARCLILETSLIYYCFTFLFMCAWNCK